MDLIIKIELEPVTKKNSQRIAVNRRTGTPFVRPSEKYEMYENAAGYYLYGLVDEPIDEPVNVEMVFYMKTRRRVDLVNLEEAALDVLVKWHILADDNSKIVVSMDGSRVRYDKNRPRTEIYIKRLKENEI